VTAGVRLPWAPTACSYGGGFVRSGLLWSEQAHAELGIRMALGADRNDTCGWSCEVACSGLIGLAHLDCRGAKTARARSRRSFLE